MMCSLFVDRNGDSLLVGRKISKIIQKFGRQRRAKLRDGSACKVIKSLMLKKLLELHRRTTLSVYFRPLNL